MKLAYTYDFEVYGERSRDGSDAEVDVFVAHDTTGIPTPLSGNQVLIVQRTLSENQINFHDRKYLRFSRYAKRYEGI